MYIKKKSKSLPKSVLCLVAQSCLTLCNPMDCSLPASSVYGILQARVLEWVAMERRQMNGAATTVNLCKDGVTGDQLEGVEWWNRGQFVGG